ncbi:MAG: hypothetical protein ACRDSP_00385 [Pseudonocardiaceae bacterium]
MGGTGFEADRLADVASSGVHASAPAPDGRPLLAGRARGVVAGTLLACGSVLAVAVHAADNSSAPPDSIHPGFVTVSPDAVPGGNVVTSLAVADRVTDAPAVTRTQAFTGTAIPSQPVHRNAPLAVDVPATRSATVDHQAPAAPAGADRGHTPQSGPLQRALDGPAPPPVSHVVDQVSAPADQVLNPVAPLAEHVVPPVQRVTAPVGKVLAELVALPQGEATQPAMTMLSPGRSSR